MAIERDPDGDHLEFFSVKGRENSGCGDAGNPVLGRRTPKQDGYANFVSHRVQATSLASGYAYVVSYRGPLPRYFQASLRELHSDRLNLPGVSAESIGTADRLSVGEVEDIHFPVSLAEKIIAAASPAGGRVLDPFAGYGTTLLACENLGREAVGVELLPEHVAICRKRAPRSTVIEGDSRGLYRLVEGPFDLVFTAPPFRTKNHHPVDPLTGYELEAGDYESYLDSLTSIASQVAQLLRPGGYFIVNAANIRYKGVTTTLAWDLAARFGEVIPFVTETMIVWDEMPHDFSADYVLTFQVAD